MTLNQVRDIDTATKAYERTVRRIKLWTGRVRKALTRLSLAEVVGGHGEWRYGGRVCNPVCSVKDAFARDILLMSTYLDEGGVHWCTFRVRTDGTVEVIGPVWIVE